MDTNKILDADLLDIIFEGKNKEYGAYEIRKTYNKRMMKALLSTGGIIFFICTGYFLSGLRAANGRLHAELPDVTLVAIPESKIEPPPVVPPPKPQPVQIKTTSFTTIQIVKVVPPDEHPPTQDDLVDTKIGKVNLDGVADAGITAPPTDGDRGVLAAPAKKAEGDGFFLSVEKEADYPGGMAAWQRYMYKNFRYPEEAISGGISGVVIVQFVVDGEGNVSDVHAVSGPDQGGLREEAERVIKRSGKWVPALQNGRNVKSYKKQPVVFKLGDGQ